MTNSPAIAEELNKKCDKTHEHRHLMSGCAADAARYPKGLCEAICRGWANENRRQAQGVKCLMTLNGSEQIDVINNEHEEPNIQAWDDITGEHLDAKEVTKARLKEMEYANAKNVWTKMPRWMAERDNIKVIKTRWIDIDKGDASNRNLRSRFVAKEFNTGNEEGLFAATPPLEALKFLISQAATTNGDQTKESVIMINDVARAFFEAPVTRDVRIEIPNEDKTEDDWKQDMVGKLNMSLYGTRDAASNFQK